MSKKNSYMNQTNLITEGFFSKLAKMFSLSSKEEKTLKKNKKFMKSFKEINSSLSNLEKMMNDEMKTYGSKKKIKLDKFKLTDFIKGV